MRETSAILVSKDIHGPDSPVDFHPQHHRQRSVSTTAVWTSRVNLRVAQKEYIFSHNCSSITYDHRLKRIGHPVRSAIHKLQIGGLVVGWVTTSESPLLVAQPWKIGLCGSG
ncbi:hypothetical protein BofuT4_P071780.1 [Botrytis cinerea T4]|uniref:Uncharacterized protein n=1 Tax=Botryotinia fuckeliana (strain T4) TaxID=999810 RepID=G2XPZ4_BOTF4|nr:hypothetical protein BofuT4_P071780.1 [Botrytis cinerea T4]